jgi:hypothetical protein
MKVRHSISTVHLVKDIHVSLSFQGFAALLNGCDDPEEVLSQMGIDPNISKALVRYLKESQKVM